MNARRQNGRPASGFTLLEILVVMVIAGLMIALIPPLFSSALPGTQLKGSVRDFAVALRETRSQAIIYNREQLVYLDLETPRYRVGNGKPTALPNDVDIDVELVTGDRLQDEARHVLRFFPDGSSSGELISLSGSGRTYRLHLNWLTGSITITEGTTDV